MIESIDKEKLLMNNLLVDFVFYIFAAVAIVSSFMVIVQNNPVRSVLFLVLTFFATAVLWLLQGAEFLALILILVYVGAVMTLFLFIVMMLNIDAESIKSHFAHYLPFGLILVALLVGLLIVALPNQYFHFDKVLINHSIKVASVSNTQEIGMVLYTNYVFAFE